VSYREAGAAGDYLALSSVVLSELGLLDFDDEDARTAGQLRATLEKAGTPIGAYDLLIAGQALRRGLTVVTANTSEFSQVTGLSWQDWTT
jgi:tRNA(fMet)-specific endonuclease VapC